MSKKTIRTARDNAKAPPVHLDPDCFFGFELDSEQLTFRDSIWNAEKLIIFCNAKAGTGKTLIATGTAKLLYDWGLYDGIVFIASPTQETKNGFLPGTAEEKAEPYFEPFYQACAEVGINPYIDINDRSISGQKRATGYVDCVTHMYLRGVNFDRKVVIIDEAQNFTFSDLQKTLTRCKDTCKVIVIGHTGQCDLDSHADSGFSLYADHFSGDDRTAVITLTKNYRGWISQHADSLNPSIVKENFSC